ncbi:MAG: DUF389 domain-containing protein [Leptospiraceae bacterium]|nr:DUF389 domain-containing protein [Leptospiraceae bacterium]
MLRVFRGFIGHLFNLGDDTDEKGTIDSIKRGIEFSGGNLWSLVFAIFIASVGLNVNSTAVIIGAMLISPLMGPIMGAGLAVGIYDFGLLRKSLRNLAVATFVSVLTSAFYFWISPLNEAQSELLARTTPTLYDVLIAVFGGAAGIVAGSRKDKTNAIPGVAIATALMPPLCTAGYGLANGNYVFFFGAIYLFIINCIFICFSTIFFVQLLRFKKVSFVDQATQRRVRNYMILFGVITIIPSLYFAWRLVDESFYRRNSARFVREALVYPGTRILNYELDYNADPRVLSVALFGNPLAPEAIETLKRKLPVYDLTDVALQIDQARTGSSATENDVKDFIGTLYKQNEDLIKNKDDRIRLLENELLSFKDRSNLLPTVSREISFLFPNIQSFSFGDVTVAQVDSQSTAKEQTAIVRWKRRPGAAEEKKLELYLKSRLNLPQIRIIKDGP